MGKEKNNIIFINKKNMKKIIRLTESDIRKIVRKTINEISYGKAGDTAYWQGAMFKQLEKEFHEFYSTLLYHYESIRNENKYIDELIKHSDAINSILQRKLKQADDINDTLQGIDLNAWENDPNTPEDADYKDIDVRGALNKYPR